MISYSTKISGKTYSLFGINDSTNVFYDFIEKILSRLLQKHSDEKLLLNKIHYASKRKKYYINFISDNLFLKESENVLYSFTPGVESHLKNLSIFKFRETALRLKEWQYHMYMLEFALTNKINKKYFLDSDVKIALLPHCLRDLTKECKSDVNGLDYQCKHCSKCCFINEASKILKEKNIIPYIWMTANIRTISKKYLTENKTLGILGIACIPELVRGMRSCAKKNIPAIGIPLDANRCIRWMGNFYANSVNLQKLKELIAENLL